MNSMQLATLIAVLGDYCRQVGGVMMQQVFTGLESVQNGVEVITTVKDELEMATPFIGDIVKRTEPDVNNTTNNAIDWQPKRLKVRPFEVELLFNPLAYHATWLSHFMMPGTDMYQMPFSTFIMQLIKNQVIDNLENIVWNGVFQDFIASPPVAGAAAPLLVADGFRKKVADAITGLTLTPVATGAINNTNAVASFEAMYVALNDNLKYRAGTKLYCSPSLAEAYNQNYRSLNGSLPYNTQFGKRTLEISEGTCEIVPMKKLAGSGRVIIDPANVLKVGTDLLSDAENITVERHKKFIYVFVHGKIGTELVNEKLGAIEYLVVNNQA